MIKKYSQQKPNHNFGYLSRKFAGKHNYWNLFLCYCHKRTLIISKVVLHQINRAALNIWYFSRPFSENPITCGSNTVFSYSFHLSPSHCPLLFKCSLTLWVCTIFDYEIHTLRIGIKSNNEKWKHIFQIPINGPCVYPYAPVSYVHTFFFFPLLLLLLSKMFFPPIKFGALDAYRTELRSHDMHRIVCIVNYAQSE